MAETSGSRRPSRTNDADNKLRSAFYQTVILPSKTYKDKNKPPAEELIKYAKSYAKQPSLKKVDIENRQHSIEKRICLDMLRKGYHGSFRELRLILDIQKKDREDRGIEHPLRDHQLLGSEPDRLRFLVAYLNKAEDAERREQHSVTYRSYLELALFFLTAEDFCLSDLFYNKCLTHVQTHSQMDSHLIADAYLNVGLAYEKKGELLKAIDYVEKYRQLSEHYYDMKTDACRQLTRLYIKLVERYGNNAPIQYILKAYEASKHSDDRKIENETSYKLGRAYLSIDDVESALKYYHQYYDYCQEERDSEGFGQACEALAICYQKKENLGKVSEYLNKCLNNSSNRKDSDQYGRACGTLALIETTLGRYGSALESSSRAFSVALANNNVDLDRHRVLYGIVNGLRLRSKFNDRVINDADINDLCAWKFIRFESYLK